MPRQAFCVAVAAVLPLVVGGCQESPTMDLVDTAVGTGDFRTLMEALDAAHLVDAIKEGGEKSILREEWLPLLDRFEDEPKEEPKEE